MDKRLAENIKKAFEQHYTTDEIRHELQSKGYLEDDIEEALHTVLKAHGNVMEQEREKTIKKFLWKEILDKIGYGFGAHQFVNILFLHTGASLLVIGLINGLRALLSVFVSGFLTEYAESRPITKQFIGHMGIAFGFSFLGMAFARFFHSVPLFIMSLLIGTVGVVSHGELYEKLFAATLRKEKRGYWLEKIALYGILILGVSMLFSAMLMDFIPETGATVKIFGVSLRAYGYLISFEITAFAFIISGYILSFIKEKHAARYPELGSFWLTVKHHAKKYLTNPTTAILALCATITGAVEVIGYSYYGIYIFETFKRVGFGGYLNVALVFMVAIVFSLISPKVAQELSRRYGKVPMLAFGSVLLSTLPFTFYFNPTLWTLAAAAAVSIIGGAVVGLSTGLLINDLIVLKKDRKLYFSSFSLLATVPYAITVPFGAWFAQTYTLRPLFLWLGIALLIVAGLYFLILLTHRREII